MKPCQPATVLVVDDEAPMRDLLREYLEPEGYTVVTAKDGAEAWGLLEDGSLHFDALLTDRNMPRMNGLQLLAKVQQEPRFHELPVIFQTAYAAREEMAEGLRAGVYYYLAKPYDRLVLLALLGTAIDEYRQRCHLRSEASRRNQALGLLRSGEFRYRTLEESHLLTPLLAQLSCDPQKVVAGLSELLVNAVEHGNLEITYPEKGALLAQGLWQEEIERRLALPEYRDRYARVELLAEARQTTFIITDQGRGFDWHKYLAFDPDRAMDIHGRGIALSRLMSFDSLEYLGSGNQVMAIVRQAA